LFGCIDNGILAGGKNTISIEKLKNIFRIFDLVKYWKRIAKKIVRGYVVNVLCSIDKEYKHKSRITIVCNFFFKANIIKD
jgi:hypothetical protein